MFNKTGILLINLGTPDHPDPKSVYRYLKQFLNDPRVIDLPGVLRTLLVNLLIVPFRYKKSAVAYSQIWTDAGSPLLVNSLNLKNALAQVLPVDFQVELGMRYGQPSIDTALANLSTCDKIIILPLFPQYSSAATGSALAAGLNYLSQQWNIPAVIIKNNFYANSGFIEAYAAVIQQAILQNKPDLLLFSYHGLPERHITKSACKAICDHQQACPAIDANNAYCYRAQCYETSRLLTAALNVTDLRTATAFQSRLGKTPWIKPYTDKLLAELYHQGIRSLAVVCPSFVADCLETLEEVNIRLREQWRLLGGSEFLFIPCLNDHPAWVKALSTMAIDTTPACSNL